MSGSTRLRVVLAWHMHQPQYRDPITGDYQLPWTYLHAIKDYVDMAAHLEATPGARAVVNFAPVLLEQIADYAAQVRGYLGNVAPIRDPLLAALANPVLPGENSQRLDLIRACLRANEEHLIGRFPAYRRLAQLAPLLEGNPELLGYLDDQYLADLLVWYHLAWLGESVRRNDRRVARLQEQGRAYTLHDRCELLGIIGETLADVIPRYRRLAESGRAELSVTPYAHPILPLLLEFASAREALPELILPGLARYPGGEARARWHVEQGIACFRAHFGREPQGCWPAEGGVSEAAVRLLGEYGFRWVATGQQVLAHSAAALGGPSQTSVGCQLYQPHRVGGRGPACFFRDDGLSDLIGFSYAKWHADDAVANLLVHLENIARQCQDQAESVATIILDGENAWEYYPENGYHFLSALYRRLSEHPLLQLSTFSECLDSPVPVRSLARLVAGSWVYGTFSTWIGAADKNRGWDLLVAAKRAFDEVMTSGRLDAQHREAAERQLAICEGSDWFWWFGDYNPAASVSQFDHLFRQHLASLYHLLGREPPDELAKTISVGKGQPQHGGVMRPGLEHA